MKSTCRETRKQLIPFTTQQLGGGNARDVADHLSACPLCRQEAEELQKTWELMGRHPVDERFKDITGAVVEKARSADERETLLGKIITLTLRVPAPALCTFIAVLALPAGIYLGKHLHLTLSAASAAYRAEEVAAETGEPPLDIFKDLSGYSLGSIGEFMAPEEDR